MKVFEDAMTGQCPEVKPAIDKINHLLSRYDLFRDFELTRRRFSRTYVIPALSRKGKGRWKDRGSRD